jgi:alcohol dehydrogenase (NADP+)
MIFPIPASIPPEIAAPMLCAGLTVYSPLIRNHVGPNTRIGIIGIGGLGHFAIMFAFALGATITAISHSSSKASDAASMGATSFIDTGSENWWAGKERSFDILLCTSLAKNWPIEKFISLLDVGGTLVYVGIPEENLPTLAPGVMIGNGSALRGSNTGSRKEALEMLKLVEKRGIRSWVEVMEMGMCGEAIGRMERGEARYRIVLKV